MSSDAITSAPKAYPTITASGTIEIPVPKVGETLTVDLSEMDAAGLAYAITYGLRQAVNDSISSYKTDECKIEGKRLEAKAFAEKRLEAIMAGDIQAQTRQADHLGRAISTIAARLAGYTKLSAKERATIRAKIRQAASPAHKKLLEQAELLAEELKAAEKGTGSISAEGLL